ncbi:arsenic resistance protein [Xanthomonas campestris pv. campestris]|nr:arsenic resistance protein [Xanthomonas campestris pv. campestris]
MNTVSLRDQLEHRQISIYFAAIVSGLLIAMTIGGTQRLESWINPALGVMLFVTFLQVPIARLRDALANVRFMSALLTANFVAIPALVFVLSRFFPAEPLIRIAILFVLLCPCIDYVVTFSQLGKADSSLLLASTPVLLLAQMALLPVYLSIFMGTQAAGLVSPGPFLHAFGVLIVIPLALSVMLQLICARSATARRLSDIAGVMPVPATAFVLLIVIAAVTPQLGLAARSALAALPIYVAFAIVAPVVGYVVGRVFGLKIAAVRALAFSAGTRNSLVVLPLAMTVPGALPVVPAVIVAQTLVELVASIAYIRVMPKVKEG